LPQSPAIAQAFKEFQHNAGRNGPRYQALIGLQEKSLADLAELNTEFGSVILKKNLEKVHTLLKRTEGYHSYREAFEKSMEPEEIFVQALSPHDQKSYHQRKDAIGKELDDSLAHYYEEKAKLLGKSEFPGEGRKLEVSKGPRLDSGKVANLDSYGVQRELRIRTLFLFEQMKIPSEVLNLSPGNHPGAVMQGAVSLSELGRMVKSDAPKPEVAPKAAPSAAKEKSFLNCVLKFVKSQ
jgi:hypothetical protein